MLVIEAQNVNWAYERGWGLLHQYGEMCPSRAGTVFVMSTPVTTVYKRPQERVLFDPGRDANPFFHLFESLWMLAGWKDATWLDRFVKDFSSRFAEEDGCCHGAYGYRWRFHFDMEGGGAPGLPDQLDTLVKLLKADPNDRRVVLSMWDPVADLDVSKNDIPCNTQAYFRIRTETRPLGTVIKVSGSDDTVNEPLSDKHQVLDMTVCCRSNDAIWGAYGANAVHFSMLQEYLAGRIGVDVGCYYQVSNNFHAYENILNKVGEPGPMEAYPGIAPIGNDWGAWDEDLMRFMEWTASPKFQLNLQSYPFNPWFKETAEPMYVAHAMWANKMRDEAVSTLNTAEQMAPDWSKAALAWMERRMK